MPTTIIPQKADDLGTGQEARQPRAESRALVVDEPYFIDVKRDTARIQFFACGPSEASNNVREIGAFKVDTVFGPFRPEVRRTHSSRAQSVAVRAQDSPHLEFNCRRMIRPGPELQSAVSGQVVTRAFPLSFLAPIQRWLLPENARPATCTSVVAGRFSALCRIRDLDTSTA